MDTWKIFLWVYSPLSPGFGGLAVRDGLDLQPVKGDGLHKIRCLEYRPSKSVDILQMLS